MTPKVDYPVHPLGLWQAASSPNSVNSSFSQTETGPFRLSKVNTSYKALPYSYLSALIQVLRNATSLPLRTGKTFVFISVDLIKKVKNLGFNIRHEKGECLKHKSSTHT